MYSALLHAHSGLRWVVLALGITVLVQAAKGFGSSEPWEKAQDKLQLAFIAALDIMMLIGLGLYFVFSPITQAAFQDMGAAMSDTTLRFFAVEHIFEMLIAIVVAHVGRAVGKRKVEKRNRIVTITTAIWLLLTFIAIPWPFMPVSRGLF